MISLAPDIQPSDPNTAVTNSLQQAVSPAPVFIAAVDLGSNSFHMLLTRYEDGEFIHIARAKQMVQLARGIDTKGNLCSQAQSRAVTCLQDFRKILNQYPEVHIAAAATKVLRMANSSCDFIKRAESILEAPVELISGEQEALLVYKGMAHNMPAHPSRRLVIDIGGASTELIVGQHQQALQLKSLDLGCVTSAEAFFTPSQEQARICASQFKQCYQHACTQLEPAKQNFAAYRWDICAGASGTLRVIAELLEQTSICSETAGAVSECSDPVIARTDLQTLIDQMLTSGALPDSLPDNLRYDVLPAGLAILKALFDQFGFEQLLVASASLKEGLLHHRVQQLEQESL
jgi:exopolyphosphatase / guanosine-5'-triphosphate,3'-diphosphate pyrophosphatase